MQVNAQRKALYDERQGEKNMAPKIKRTWR
jgi:hypothetical protein